MTVLLAVAGGLVTLLLIATMVLLVPRGTQQLRRRQGSPAETQGADLAPDEEGS